MFCLMGRMIPLLQTIEEPGGGGGRNTPVEIPTPFGCALQGILPDVAQKNALLPSVLWLLVLEPKPDHAKSWRI